MKLLVDRIIVTDEEVEIRYVIPTSSESEHILFCHLRLDYLHHPPTRQRQEAFGRHELLPIYGHALFGPFPRPRLIKHLFGGSLARALH